MNPRIHKRAAVQLDLLEHFIYIGENNLDAADRFLTAVQTALEKLAEMPGMGALREFENPEFHGVRSWPITGFENFLIFYRPMDNGIDVIRVLSGYRDLNRLFGVKDED